MFFLSHLLTKPDTEYTGQVRHSSLSQMQLWNRVLFRRVTFRKCIKAVNGTSFLLVTVFDVSMSREAVEQHLQTIKTIHSTFSLSLFASPVMSSLNLVNEVLHNFSLFSSCIDQSSHSEWMICTVLFWRSHTFLHFSFAQFLPECFFSLSSSSLWTFWLVFHSLAIIFVCD